MKKITLNEQQSLVWDKEFAHAKNIGAGDMQAEREAIKALKREFPGLKYILVGDFKILP